MEIVSPAGSLTAGLWALSAGADAVYFGLPRFSARQAAANLSLSDVRRLKGQAVKQGARIYAALNTVIAEAEMPLLHEWLVGLVLAGVDAVLVQDLGAASAIRRWFPKLPLHASTQLAVHNTEGLLTARRFGFERVVLSRELSLVDIARLKPGPEAVAREVFVHGALCYGFSGLCLASSLMTGRSSNRGACAQICRSWFERGDERGYYFSAVDIDGGSLIGDLKGAGVSALKIEGRLKSPAYAFNTTAYYRALVDGDPEKATFYRTRSALSFTRPTSGGFLKMTSGIPLINPTYPSHVGIPGALVVSGDAHYTVIRALEPLFAHDRLFRLPKGPPDRGTTIVMTDFRVNGRRVGRVAKGEIAKIAASPGLRPGDTLMKTLSHDKHLKVLTPELYPEYKTALTLKAGVAEAGLRLGVHALGATVDKSYAVTIEKSRAGRAFDAVLLARFSESRDHAFTFESLSPFQGAAPLPSDIFVPLSALKRIRNDFYEQVELALLGRVAEKVALDALSGYTVPLPQREQLIYPDGFPFVPEGALCPAAQWPVHEGRRYLCLPPVMFESAKTIAFFEAELARHQGEPFAVGLSNIGHLEIAGRWQRFDQVSFFIDYGIYVANTATLIFLLENVPRLDGAYLWIEADAEQRSALTAQIRAHLPAMPAGLSFIEKPQIFPIFISRVCLHGFTGSDQCHQTCPRSFDERLMQNRRAFDVKVRSCRTYVFLASPFRVAIDDPHAPG